MSEAKNTLHNFLSKFQLQNQAELFSSGKMGDCKTGTIAISGVEIPVYTNEFWTSKQRQSASIHEISYRACFKAQLPRFFIELFTIPGDIVYDPFSGRGTTGLEAGLMGRKTILNDINPLSEILSRPRFFIPSTSDVKKRLQSIPLSKTLKAELDLSMFYHADTESEIVALRNYLKQKIADGKEDDIDRWVRMVATNRLTGHSSGFFSVYTLPPNQAVSPERQQRINKELSQKPEYRDTISIILKKTSSLLRSLSVKDIANLRRCGDSALFLGSDARYTKDIPDETVQLTVTSPPFLNIVQYADDNWLRCWFNDIDYKEINAKITIAKDIDSWSNFIREVFKELFRVTKPGGWVAFEVGEIRSGKIKLEEYVAPAGLESGFKCEGILINEQVFTKTSNIWGIKNNSKGTNSNRIVLFRK
jgi:hypothetical protein